RDQAPELELHEERAKLRAIGAVILEIFDRGLDGDVGLQRAEDLREARIVGVLDERLAGLALHLAVLRGGEHAFEIAVIEDELRGGLRSDPLYAGDVVARVAAEREDIEELLRRHAELLLDLLGPESSAPHRLVHADAIRDELHQILVAGYQ